MTIEISGHPALSRTMQGGDMLQADEVVAMLRLHELGWGAKRLSKKFGWARNTVRRYLREGGSAPLSSLRASATTVVFLRRPPFFLTRSLNHKVSAACG